MKNVYLPLICFLFLFIKAEATDISATGGWTQTINASNLVSGAGSNLIATYQSATNATTLTISNPTGTGGRWLVNVQRTDILWSSNFTLYVQRTSNGTGTGTITGGTSYIIINTTATQFFSGRRARSGINLQYELTGMSINVPPSTYSTTVTFTVVDA
jgi:hypothetical protein